MNKDEQLLAEAYSKITEVKASSTHGTPVYNRSTSAPGPRPGYDAIQNTINQKMDDKELGPDPKEADELEAIMKKHKPEYESTPFWDAYSAVKDGLWSEDEFVQWSRSVWADGANEGSTPR